MMVECEDHMLSLLGVLFVTEGCNQVYTIRPCDEIEIENKHKVKNCKSVCHDKQ